MKKQMERIVKSVASLYKRDAELPKNEQSVRTLVQSVINRLNLYPTGSLIQRATDEVMGIIA